MTTHRPSRSLRALGALVAALAATAVLAAPAPAATITTTGGATTAVLSWTSTEDDIFARDIAFTITRAGVATTPALECDSCMLLDDASTVAVADLDADGEPEVVVNRFSGGAHCCTDALIYRFDPATATYAPLVVETGNQGYRLEDLDGDGRPEIVTRDDRFAGAYTAYAASASPLLVLQYAAGAVSDVSRAQRGAVRTDTGRLRKELRKLKRSFDHRGLLAAYVAGEYLGARASRGRRELDREVRLKLVSPAFRRLLLRDLKRWGYR